MNIIVPTIEMRVLPDGHLKETAILFTSSLLTVLDIDVNGINFNTVLWYLERFGNLWGPVEFQKLNIQYDCSINLIR